ncbi:MAG: 23S rRNA (pseudouridine(1915)-N(3))-methyltransferase RlmH [Paludibacteraceae bacterium]|nr:23S rRNA (pseudouridine(1915)-N(3))-methyltransferase RlmH [Paludibacteraceae bacterium]
MKVTWIVVGKTTDRGLEQLIDDYVGRLGHYLSFEVKVLPELRNARSLSAEQQKQTEGDMIIRAIDGTSGKRNDRQEVILLDERGSELRSIEWAAMLEKKQAGNRDLTFVIGGPYGFSKSVYDRADGMLSLSRMTFSHQMIRLLFVEQLYRAMTIIRGEKYHHE